MHAMVVVHVVLGSASDRHRPDILQASDVSNVAQPLPATVRGIEVHVHMYFGGLFRPTPKPTSFLKLPNVWPFDLSWIDVKSCFRCCSSRT